MEPKSPEGNESATSQNFPISKKATDKRPEHDQTLSEHQLAKGTEKDHNHEKQFDFNNQSIIGSSSIIHADKSHSVEKKWIEDQMTENDEKITELEEKIKSLHDKCDEYRSGEK